MKLNNKSPVLILNTNTKRDQGKQAQMANINAAKAIADIITTTLGPRSMMKMLMDPMGGIVMTNDGHAILREIDCKHPTAKSLIELARMQDEEVGDGTTSVIILTGEMMQSAKPFIENNIHPTILVKAYFKALREVGDILEKMAIPINLENPEDCKKALTSCIGTKFAKRWGDLIVNLSLDACRIVLRGTSNVNKLNVEIKRYAKIEKLPGGLLEDSKVIHGVMINKDVTFPTMRRHIKNPRVLLLDCPLEYKKAESQTDLKMMKETDMSDALQQEINEIAQQCSAIMKWNPDVVITEKGLSDLTQHFLLKQNISCLRRVRKTDNNRIARVTGARIVNRPEEIEESDIGTKCGLFEVRKIGDDYFTFFEECENPSACTIILTGGSKDSLNEMERNLHDALGVARNIFVSPKILPGGGATEMELSKRLNELSKSVSGLMQKPFKAVAYSLEAIPRTLAQNSGGNVVRLLTELRAKHSSDSEDSFYYGIDGNKGTIADMREVNVWEPLLVKNQVIKTAIESCCMLLRIDDVVSGIKKTEKQQPHRMDDQHEDHDHDTFGDQRDG